jgi:hypothetical protein
MLNGTARLKGTRKERESCFDIVFLMTTWKEILERRIDMLEDL